MLACIYEGRGTAALKIMPFFCIINSWKYMRRLKCPIIRNIYETFQ